MTIYCKCPFNDDGSETNEVSPECPVHYPFTLHHVREKERYLLKQIEFHEEQIVSCKNELAETIAELTEIENKKVLSHD